MDHKKAAREIFEGLTPGELRYARSEELGARRGFRALHDLMDANELVIPYIDMARGHVTPWVQQANDVMAELDRLILKT